MQNRSNIPKKPPPNYEVPHELHFIWYGSFIPNPQRARVETWATENPDYKVNVWYDPNLLTTKELHEFEEWKKLFPNLVLRNVNQELPFNPHARYESAGPFPNYAARSDIDRYRILKNGGIYLDTDIGFRKKLGIILAKLGIKFNTSMQNVDTAKVNEAHGVIGNDIIASLPNNSFIQSLNVAMEQVYLNNKLFSNLEEIVSGAFDRNIEKIGPMFLREQLYKQKYMSSPSRAGILNAMCRIESEYFDCEENDLSWVNEKIIQNVNVNNNNQKVSVNFPGLFGSQPENETRKRTLRAKIYDSNDSFLKDVAIRVSYEIYFHQQSLLSSYLLFSPNALTLDDLDNLKKYVTAEFNLLTKNQNTEAFSTSFNTEMIMMVHNLEQINAEIQAHSIIVNIDRYIKQNFKETNVTIIRKLNEIIHTYLEQYEEGKLPAAVNILETIRNEVKQGIGDEHVPSNVYEFLEVLTGLITEIEQFLLEEKLKELAISAMNNNKPV